VGINTQKSIIVSDKSWKGGMEEQTAAIQVCLLPDEQRLELMSLLIGK
jgi:hypothetical protein